MKKRSSAQLVGFFLVQWTEQARGGSLELTGEWGAVERSSVVVELRPTRHGEPQVMT